MCTKNEVKTIVQKVAKVYQNVYAENLVRVILYGSYARGNYTNESDVDIVAIVKGTRDTLQKQLKVVWDASSDLELEYGVIISPTVIPLDEFEKYREDIPYYRNIAQEGVEFVA